MGLKDFYFKCEDKWYAGLDKLEEKGIPVYKVIEPIDKIIPSFALFLIISVLLIVLLIVLLFPSQPQVYESYLEVLDSEGVALSSIGFALTSADSETFTVKSDDDGLILIELTEPEMDIDVTLLNSDFKDFDKTLTFKADETTTIELTSKNILLGPTSYTINITDSTNGQLITQTVSLDFKCSSSYATSPLPQSTTSGKYVLKATDIPSGCGTLSVKASSSGFQEKTRNLSTVSSNLNIVLQPEEPEETTGGVIITVYDDVFSPVELATVNLIKSSTGAQIDSGLTTASGNYEFEEVEPGTYFIRAIALDGREKESSEFSVYAGDIESISITLDELIEGNKLFFKIVDSDSDIAIDGASITVFKGGTFYNNYVTDLTGVIEVDVSIDDSTGVISAADNFSGVISKSGYLLKIVNSLPVRDSAETSVPKIPLTAVDATNAGKINISVLDEDDVEQDGATIFVYYSMGTDSNAIIINSPQGDLTDSTGSFSIDNLPAGDYFVKAEKDDSEGITSTESLISGDEIDFEIILVLGQGDIEVTVIKESTDEEIENAKAEFIDVSTGESIADCLTDVDGECSSGLIPADKEILVVVSKTNFVSTYYAKKIDVQNGATKKIDVYLKADSEISSSLKTNYVKICSDSECKHDESRLESDDTEINTYYLRFETIVPDDQDEVNQYIVLGPEDITNLSQGSNIITIDRVFAVGSSSIELYPCFDSSNLFNAPNCNEVDNSDGTEAKIALIKWEDVEGSIVLPITLKILVEPALNDSEEARVKYGVKDNESNEDSGLYIFHINERSCDDSGKNLLWDFALTDLDSGVKEKISNQSSSEKIDLMVNKEYELEVNIFNCTTGISDATLTRINTESNNVIELTPPSFSSLTIDSENQFVFPFSMKGIGTTASEEIELGLSLSTIAQLDDSAEQSLYFSVSGNSPLFFQDLTSPVSIYSPLVEGKIIDEDDNPIEGVLVKASCTLIDNCGEAVTNSTGNFSIYLSQNSGTPNSVILLEASLPGYLTETATTFFGEAFSFTEDFSCLEINSITGTKSVTMEYNTELAEEKTLEISAENCEENKTYDLRLQSELDIIGSNDLQLNSGETKTITVKAQTNSSAPLGLGEYYVGIVAKTNQGTYSGVIDEVIVYIEQQNSNIKLVNPLNNEINKTVFDISHKIDEGKFITQNYASSDDDSGLPSVSVEAVYSNASASSGSENSIILDWSAEGTIQEVSDINIIDFTDDQGNPVLLPKNIPLEIPTINEDGSGQDVYWIDVLMHDSESNLDGLSLEYESSDGSLIKFTPNYQTNTSWNESPKYFLKTYRDNVEASGIVGGYSPEEIGLPEVVTGLGLGYVFNSSYPLTFGVKYRTILNPDECQLGAQTFTGTNVSYYTKIPHLSLNRIITGVSFDIDYRFKNYFSMSYKRIKLPDNCQLSASVSDGWNGDSYRTLSFELPDGYALQGLGFEYFKCIKIVTFEGCFPTNEYVKIWHRPLTIVGVSDGWIPIATGVQDNGADGFDYAPIWQGLHYFESDYDLAKTEFETNNDADLTHFELGANQTAINTKKIKLTSNGDETKLYSVALKAKKTTNNTNGEINFTISNNSLNGNHNYALIKVQDSTTTGDVTQYFHVKLKTPPISSCVNADGSVGAIGSTLKPKIKLSWNFDEFSANTCDLGGEGIYCDPVQFSTELWKKLLLLEDLYSTGAPDEQIQAASEFKVLLIEDNYSNDFFKDFSEFYSSLTGMQYSNQAFYNESQSPWHDLFKSNVDVKIVDENPQTTLIKAGLYDAEIKISFDDGTNNFFSNSTPNAVVNVELSNHKTPDIDSPFYYIPFNGLVGTLDERIDYGIEFDSADTIIFSDNLNSVNLSYLGDSVNKTISGTLETEFDNVNYGNSRGKILEVTNDGTSLTLAPTNAMPVVLAIKGDETNNKTNASIAFGIDGDNPGVFIGKWTGIGSSLKEAGKCIDFTGTSLPYQKEDSKFDVSHQEYSNAFGFEYVDVEQDILDKSITTTPKVYYESVFFTPITGNPIVLNKTAPNTPQYSTSYMVNLLNQQGSVPISNSTIKIETVQDLLNAMDESLICVTKEGNNTIYSWNENELMNRMEQDVLSNIPSWTTDLKCSTNSTIGGD